MKRLYSLLTFLIFTSVSNINAEYVFKSQIGSYNAKFISPVFLTTDTAGNIYVTDLGIHNVQIFDKTGKYIRQIGGLGSDSIHLNYPYGIAISDSGNIYVADGSNNRIQVFKNDGTYLRSFGSKGKGNGQFSFPYGIALTKKADTVLVSDYGNNRIQAFDGKGNFLYSVGKSGTDTAQFKSPNGVAISSTGDIYIADNGNNRVQILTSAGKYKSMFTGGTGTGLIGNIGGIMLDKADHVYLVNSVKGIINKYDKNGNFMVQYGSSVTGNGQLISPYGICLNNSGQILVADKEKAMIQIFDSLGVYTSQFTNGKSDGQLYYPNGIAFSRSGAIYVVDNGNNKIQKFDKNGNFISAITTYGASNTPFNGPSHICIDPNTGLIYITDSGNNTVVIFNENDTYKSTFGNYGSGNGQFYRPYGIAVNPTSDTILVSDYGNNRIQLFSITGTYLGQFGGLGSGAGQFNGPRGISIHRPTKQVFIADGGNSRIQKLFASGVGVGSRFFGIYGSDTDSSFLIPQNVFFDSYANIFVVDGLNNRVRIYDSNFHFLKNIDHSSSFERTFSYPIYGTTDDSGYVYISTDPYRVQKFVLLDNITTTGIADIQIEKDEVTIYPNPNTGNFSIRVDLELNGSENDYLIMNSLGQIIQTGKITSQLNNIQGLRSGLYFITIHIGKKKVVKKILVE